MSAIGTPLTAPSTPLVTIITGVHSASRHAGHTRRSRAAPAAPPPPGAAPAPAAAAPARLGTGYAKLESVGSADVTTATAPSSERTCSGSHGRVFAAHPVLASSTRAT